MWSSWARFSTTKGSVVGKAVSWLRNSSNAGTLAEGFPRIEFGNDLISQFANVGAAGHTAPRGINAIKDAIGGGIAVQGLERLGPRPVTAAEAPEIIEALGLVHGAATRGHFSKRFPGNRVIAADFHSKHIGPASTALKSAGIPENAFGLPGGQFPELVGKRIGITSQFERFERQHG